MRSAPLVLSLLVAMPGTIAAAAPLVLETPAPFVAEAGSAAPAATLAETAADASSGGSAAAQPTPERHPFVWASTGPTFAYGKTYWSLSGGVGYHIRYGLAPNIELSRMFANSPTIWSVRPGVTWFAPLPFQPYVGAYYMHWFVSGDRADRDGVGARLGLSLIRLVAFEVTYDHALSCSHDCDAWTPEVTARFTF
jgi:hypothetical protein